MQAWRGPRQRRQPTRAAHAPHRARPAGAGRYLLLALLTAAPVALVVLWLSIDSPAVFGRFAGRFLLAGLLLVLFTGMALRCARRRPLDEVRSLNRVVRRIETGDFDGELPRFGDSEVGRLAAGCLEIGTRMRRAEERLGELDAQLRRDTLRHEAVVEGIQSEMDRLRAETSVLHGFGGVLNRNLGTPQLCSELISNLTREVAYSRAIVYLLDEDGQLTPQAVSDSEHRLPLAGNFVKDTPAGQELSARTVAGWVAQTGKVLRVGDTRLEPHCADLPGHTRSVLAVPLRARQSIVGVIQLEHPHPNAYDSSDERILASLANQAGIAVENVRLFEEAAKVQALRELDGLKSELLSTVSHELRTPLASIKGYAGTLLRTDVEWDNETRREFLQIVDEESDRLGELIEDLLQMSQIESGVMRVDLRRCRLPRVIHRVVKKARATAVRHQFAVNIAPDFPEVRADLRRVEQVLRNLVENAVKYSPDGGTVTVRGDAEGGEAVVSVSDEGIGIAPEDLGRVFDRFYRADGTAVRKAGGTGLGLSICRGIVEMHGGRIWVESQLGGGSTFRFSLPLADPGASTDPVTHTQEESE
ncbi:MAG TPA: ATP-binding protein [Chloroflexota bacterium]|nr:ATP-binding protein [Chloroflexota bacterium]